MSTSDMNTTATPTRMSWHERIVSAVNTLSEELGLDDQGTVRLREFTMTTAKDQFKAGNKSGIRWARLNAPRATSAQAA